MSRLARAMGVGAAVCVLVLSPWAGANRLNDTPAYYVDDPPLFTPPAPAPALAQPIIAPFVVAQPAGGCGCDTVVINAVNELREVEVRSGNAQAVNRAVTYVSGGYAAKYRSEIEVKVRQVARAVSGDAMAGQSIALAGSRSRCHNFVVKARNVLQDVEVRSGNAKAANHSTILIDPGVNPDRLDVRLRQHALARAGNATAGQFIGAASGGGPPGCGSVRVDATNLMDEVEVRSGKAKGTNDNTITVCKEVGCAEELRELAPRSDSVQMCTTDGCRTRPGAEVAAELPDPTPRPSPTPGIDTPGTSTVVPEPTRCPRFGPRARKCREAAAAAAASPTPTPTPTPSPSPELTPTPTPTPAPVVPAA